jgi:hypothetical protein
MWSPEQANAERNDGYGKDGCSSVNQGNGFTGLSSGWRQHGEEKP